MGNAPIALALSLLLFTACAGDPFVLDDAGATLPPPAATETGPLPPPPHDAGALADVAAPDGPAVVMIDARGADRALVDAVLEDSAPPDAGELADAIAPAADAAPDAPLDAIADDAPDAHAGALCCAGAQAVACSASHFVCYAPGSTCSETCGGGVDGALVCMTSCSGPASGDCSSEGACTLGAPCVFAAADGTLPGAVARCAP